MSKERSFYTNIRESSSELTPREKIKVKDLSNGISLDSAVKSDGECITIAPEAYVILDVHNENSKSDKDYTKYVIIDVDGQKYHTGSETFFRSFIDIWEEMSECDDEPFSIEVYKRPSVNYKDKYFLTCSLI